MLNLAPKATFSTFQSSKQFIKASKNNKQKAEMMNKDSLTV